MEVWTISRAEMTWIEHGERFTCSGLSEYSDEIWSYIISIDEFVYLVTGSTGAMFAIKLGQGDLAGKQFKFYAQSTTNNHYNMETQCYSLTLRDDGGMDLEARIAGYSTPWFVRSLPECDGSRIIEKRIKDAMQDALKKRATYAPLTIDHYVLQLATEFVQCHTFPQNRVFIASPAYGLTLFADSESKDWHDFKYFALIKTFSWPTL